ncbi:MAG: cupin domain-containing protein [Lactobacillus sp.]|nr:cupin domain-containing protein [Lactobacillus sp.]
MKFELKNAELKKFGNFEILEYPNRDKFPLDGAVVKVKNGVYPKKINHGFYELFYVMKGYYDVEIDGNVTRVNEGDMFIIEPEKAHRCTAEHAEMFVVCTPPFDIKNVEFLE